MSWTLERVKEEIHVFAEHARKTIGNIDGVKELELCPVEISKRMTSTKGIFEYEYKKRNGVVIGVKPLKIKIAQHLLDNYYDEDIIDVIRHECVHHIVDLKTKGQSKGHDEIFKRYCRKLGVSDETYFNAKPKKETNIKPKKLEVKYIGKCTECGKEFPRKVMKRDTIHTWLYYSTCTCGGELHVIDLKEEVVYVQNEYKNLDNIISLKAYNENSVPVSTIKTVEDYMKDAESLKAYSYIGVCSVCEFRNEFDYLWWELRFVYDTSYKLNLTKEDIRVLKTWLETTQKFTNEFKDVSL